MFFAGPPHEILKEWRDGKVRLVISTDILKEYHRVADELAQHFPGADASKILDLVMVEAEMANTPPLPKPVCTDPEDDKFFACAVASSAEYVVTGDKQLLRVPVPTICGRWR